MLRCLLLIAFLATTCSVDASKSSGWSSLIERDSPFHVAYQNFRHYINILADPSNPARFDLHSGRDIDEIDDESTHEDEQLRLAARTNFDGISDHIVTQSIDADPSLSHSQFHSSIDDTNHHFKPTQHIQNLDEESLDQSLNLSTNNRSDNGTSITCNYGQVVTFRRGRTTVDVCYCSFDTINGRAGDCSVIRPFTCHPRLISPVDPSITLCTAPSSPISTLNARDMPPFTPLQSYYRSSEFALYDPKLTGIAPPCVTTSDEPINQFMFAIDCAFNVSVSESFAQPAQVQSLLAQNYTQGPIQPFKYAAMTMSGSNVTFAVLSTSIVTNSLRVDWTIRNSAFLSNKLSFSQILPNAVGQLTFPLTMSSLPKGSRIGGRIHTLVNFVWNRPSPGFNAWQSDVPWRLMIEDSSYSLPPPPPPRKLKSWQGVLLGLFFGVLTCLLIYRLWMWRKDRKFQQMIAEQKASSKSLYQQTG